MSKTARDQATQEAIDAFPIVRWLRGHTKVHNTHGNVVYADCPICGGQRKLGIYRQSKNGSKLAVCGRCKDGGHGRGRWDGVAGLPAFVKLLEDCDWRRAFQLIHELSEVPEARWEPDRNDDGPPDLPDGRLPLDELGHDEPAVRLLVDRGVEHLVQSSFLCIGHRKFHERIILPCHQGEIYTGFEAKATYDSQSPKSLFPFGMATQSTVYTARNWNPDDTRAAVTESVLDAETFHTLNKNAVGCYGAFKPEQAVPLLDLGIEELFWFLDGDAWDKLPGVLSHTLPFFENYLVPMPADADPNAVGARGCDELWDKAKKVESIVEFLLLTEEWR